MRCACAESVPGFTVDLAQRTYTRLLGLLANSKQVDLLLEGGWVWPTSRNLPKGRAPSYNFVARCVAASRYYRYQPSPVKLILPSVG